MTIFLLLGVLAVIGMVVCVVRMAQHRREDVIAWNARCDELGIPHSWPPVGYAERRQRDVRRPVEIGLKEVGA